MGTLRYGTEDRPWSIDDRELLHLQIVITEKLRHGEHFTFSCDDDNGGRMTFWMAPGIPLRFDYVEDTPVDIDRRRLYFLEHADGVFTDLPLVAEPA